jgi:hypothetical protein
MTTTTTGGIEPQIPAEKKSVFSRIAGVLFAPAETFQEIARRPDILAPLLIILLVGYASTLLIIPKLDVESMFEAQSAQIRKQNPDIADADLERMRTWGAASAKVFAYISPVLMVIWYVIVAGVLLGAFRLMGGEGTFKQAFSATIYAWVPLTLLAIITTVVVMARGSFDPTTAATLVRSNPAFLTSLTEQPVLFALLSALDLFTLWTLVLLIFGFSALSRLSKGRSAAIVITLWLALVFVRVGFAALGAARAAG